MLKEYAPANRSCCAQLAFAVAGLVLVTTDYSRYIVPGQAALWLPAGGERVLHVQGDGSLRMVQVSDRFRSRLPSRGRVIEVSPLLRELIHEAAKMPDHIARNDREASMISLLLDEVARSRSFPMMACMPRDPVIAKVCAMIVADPAHEIRLDECAAAAAMSRRTFTRVFRRTMGCSFERWRRDVRLLAALALFADGRSVTAVAGDVGYQSSSAFATAFRRVLGAPPRRFLLHSERMPRS